jgi:toxin ParE1/3/4
LTEVEFHPLAEEEYLQQAAWYARGSNEASLKFLDALDSTIAQIEQHPESGEADQEGLQKIILHDGYPLSLYYHASPELIYIVAVAHHSREPGYWRGRW